MAMQNFSSMTVDPTRKSAIPGVLTKPVRVSPEQHTSKTCCKCLHPCGPWVELEEKMGRKIRGVRVCQNEECRLPQNRDRTGASNIGLQFRRLYEGKSPIREMTDEEAEFNRLNVALNSCSDCD